MKHWGSIYWNFLHKLSFEYPEKPTRHTIAIYAQFMNMLPYLLPCDTCRQHLIQVYETYPLSKKIFKNKSSFSFYIYKLHNEINRKIGKNIYIPFSEVEDKYNPLQCSCRL